MRDPETSFRILDQLPLPASLDRIERLEPHPPDAEPSPHIRRAAVALVALVVSAAALLFMVRAFDRTDGGPISRPFPGSVPTGLSPARGGLTFDELIGPSQHPASELAFLAADGTVQRMTMATEAHSVAGGGAWSPDGSQVAFVIGRPDSWRFTGDGDLYVMNADGSDLRQVTSGMGVTSPTWSPDGSRLAFVRNQGTALCVIRSDGSDLHVIASDRGYYQHPRWSPVGDLILYQSRIDNTELGGRTFTIHSDGTNEQVLPPALGEGSFPSWSPDGRRLAYANGNGIAIFDLDRGQTQPLTNCSSCYGDMFPAWSPDGKQIAFVREDQQARWSLYVVDLTTGTVTRLGPPGTQQFSPAWRP